MSIDAKPATMTSAEVLAFLKGDPDAVLKILPDDQFRLAVQATAALFREMIAEAKRRGIWEDLRGVKP